MRDRGNEDPIRPAIVVLSKVSGALFKHLFLIFMNIKSLCDFFFLEAMILKCYSTQKALAQTSSNSLLLSCPSPEDMHNFFKLVAVRLVDIGHTESEK